MGLSQSVSAPTPGSNKILPLTCLRFFAALYIVFFHTAYPVLDQLRLPSLWLGTGYISVSFFFTLSGYILAIVYLKDARPLDTRRFLLARFARIYPVYFLTLLADLPALAHARSLQYDTVTGAIKTFATLFGNIFLLQAWFPRFRGLDDPNWSIAVEAIFYLLFPWIGLRLWRIRSRFTLLAAVAVYAAGMGLIYLALHAGISDDLIYLDPIFHLHEFFLGILLARWHTRTVSSHAATLRTLSAPAALLLLALLGFLPTLAGHVRMVYLRDGLLAPLFAGLIVAFAGEPNWLTRIFSAGWLVLLGEASFALYLVHMPVSHIFHFFGADRSPPAYLLYLATCIAVSILSFLFFENPTRRAILLHFSTRSPETALTSSIAQ